MINGFKEASGAMDAMANSAGELDKAYSQYEKSTEYHIKQFSATFQELSANIMQSGMIKFFVDLGSGILSAVNAVAKLKIGLAALVGVATGLIATKNNVGRDKMFSLTLKVNVPTVITVLLGYGRFRYYGCCNTAV